MSSHTHRLSDALRQYLHDHGVRETEVQRALREHTSTLEWGVMQVSPEQGAFMHLLVKLMGARRIVEVGTFTGYSALAMASALPDDGLLLALDVSEEWTSIAEEYWAKAGVRDKVCLELGPALDTLDRRIGTGDAGTFDLAFIDADKTHYVEYYERCLTLLRPGGAVLVDNVLWGGAVVDPAEQDPSTEAIRQLNDHVAHDARVEIVMLPIGDGLTIARKL